MLATTVLLCAVALLTACEGAGVDGNGFDKANNSPAIRALKSSAGQGDDAAQYELA